MINLLLLRNAFEVAYSEALISYEENEVPVGACLIVNNKIITSSRNQIKQKKDPIAHAEIQVIRNACNILNNERLTNSILVTTLEPCILCSGAILLSRIKHVFFLSYDNKYPAMKDVINLGKHNHTCGITHCNYNDLNYISLLQDFFRNKRIV